jgi:hypothetical protein
MNDMTLWDVYENAKYGSLLEDHMVVSSGPISGVSTCEVLNKKCKTGDEFNQLTQPYISN